MLIEKPLKHPSDRKISSLNCVPLISCAMNLTTLLANFALIKVIYIIFFLVLVVVINVSFLKRQKKKEDAAADADIYITDAKACCGCIENITSKN